MNLAIKGITMPGFREYIVEKTHAELSVESYLRSIHGISGRQIQKLTRAKGIYLNGKRTIMDKKLKYKDSLKILILQERLNIIPEKGKEIDILYENASMVVVNKPAGMSVHPVGHTTTGTLLNYLAGMYETEHDVHLHAVNRLDRDTSGCVLFAKNAESKQMLDDALQNGAIKRVYHAIVLGKPESDIGTIDAKIAADPFSPNRRIVSANGKEAITEYRVLAELENDLYMLELNLLTGRTHQIRVHLSYAGTPILGDGMYGIRKFNAKRQLLHAVKMYFSNIGLCKDMVIEAPVFEDMKGFIIGKK